jgi:branched-subunit amino acid ABC-type transport system permease component
MTDLPGYVLNGIPTGCVFALMAVGIVLTYKTSGVFNLAFGAQAFVSAAIYYDTVGRNDWPPVLGFVVAVVIAGPLLGLLLDQALYRHLRTASSVAKLVTSLGLLVAIPQIVKLWFGSSPAYSPPGLIRSDRTFLSGQLTLDMNEVVTMLATVLVVLGLTILFRHTNLGLQMRAVVESPRMTELNGVDANRVGAVSWMLSSLLAALAGVLLAPLFAQVSEVNFFTLLVAALAAAAFGRLSSIPLTLIGGLLLGVLQQLLAGYLPPNSVFAQGLRPSLPFAALFLLLLFWPGLRKPRELADPLAGVDPPPPAPAATMRTPGLTLLTRALAVTFVVVMSVLTFTTFDTYWVGLVTKGVVLATIFLSFVVITGLAGQVSLCQATFAAVGAFAAAQLVANTGMSVLLAMVIGGAIAAVVGGLLALPALRLGGIYLGLATLAFALMFEYVLRPLDWIGGGTRPPRVPRPTLLGIDFSDDKKFFILAAALLAIVSVFVLVLKRGSTGRFLDALRGSEVAAATIGINPFAAKVVAFSVSAGIAGFGGALLASYDGRVNYDANMTYFMGLVWVVLVVTLGARSIQAAITAGLGFVLFAPVLDLITPLDQSTTQSVAFILFGLGALTYAKHPEGIVEARTRASLERVTRWINSGRTSRPEQARDPDAKVAVGAGR